MAKNKYLEKIAGLGSALRKGVHDFGEHLSGKALEKARMEHSVTKGLGLASKIEHSTHSEMSSQYSRAGDWDRHANEFKRHTEIMNGQHQAGSHVIHELSSGNHLNPSHIGHDESALIKKRDNARKIAGGAGAVAMGGAFAAGHQMNKQAGLVNKFVNHLSGSNVRSAEKSLEYGKNLKTLSEKINPATSPATRKIEEFVANQEKNLKSSKVKRDVARGSVVAGVGGSIAAAHYSKTKQ